MRDVDCMACLAALVSGIPDHEAIGTSLGEPPTHAMVQDSVDRQHGLAWTACDVLSVAGMRVYIRFDDGWRRRK